MNHENLMKPCGLAICLILFMLTAPVAQGQSLPRWELGIGTTVLNLPQYRGSDISRNYAIPFPYVTYRSERLNVDRGGIHGHLFQSERAKLDISLALGIPVSSDDNSPRAGMPDLDTTVELGPSLELNLWHRHSKRQSVWLHLPLRSARSIGGNGIFRHRGWTFSPYLEYTAQSVAHNDWKGSISVGPLYADRDYHNYFYQVTPAFTTATRNEYNTSGGYSGARATFTFRKKITDKIRIATFARFDTLNSAKFEESPLVTSKYYRAVGVAFIWMFSQSDEMVEIP